MPFLAVENAVLNKIKRSALPLILCGNVYSHYMYVRGESKKFVDFVNKIKSIYAISLKLPYVCHQFNTNKHRKFQTNRFINIVSMAICLRRVSATRSTPRRLRHLPTGFLYTLAESKVPIKTLFLIRLQANFHIFIPHP